MRNKITMKLDAMSGCGCGAQVFHALRSAPKDPLSLEKRAVFLCLGNFIKHERRCINGLFLG